jgi:hypothetical protein
MRFLNHWTSENGASLTVLCSKKKNYLTHDLHTGCFQRAVSSEYKKIKAGPYFSAELGISLNYTTVRAGFKGERPGRLPRRLHTKEIGPKGLIERNREKLHFIFTYYKK